MTRQGKARQEREGEEKEGMKRGKRGREDR